MARLIVDTSGYLAGMIRAHPQRQSVRQVLAKADEPPVLSPLVVAELDYLVLDRGGLHAELRMLDDLTSGAYELAEVTLDDLHAGRELATRYGDLRIGITDAVTVLLADRYQTDQVLSLDQRHLRAISPLTAGLPAFKLLPLDR